MSRQFGDRPNIQLPPVTQYRFVTRCTSYPAWEFNGVSAEEAAEMWQEEVVDGGTPSRDEEVGEDVLIAVYENDVNVTERFRAMGVDVAEDGESMLKVPDADPILVVLSTKHVTCNDSYLLEKHMGELPLRGYIIGCGWFVQIPETMGEVKTVVKLSRYGFSSHFISLLLRLHNKGTQFIKFSFEAKLNPEIRSFDW